MNLQRRNIIDGIRARLAEQFGAGGTVRPIFRDVVAGAWTPGGSIRPALTIVDRGRSVLAGNDEEGKDMLLGLSLILDLPEEWARGDNYGTWLDAIDLLTNSLVNWVKCGFGVLEFSFERDEPFDVIVGEYNAGSIWTIDFEVRYVGLVGNQEKE